MDIVQQIRAELDLIKEEMEATKLHLHNLRNETSQLGVQIMCTKVRVVDVAVEQGIGIGF